MLCSSPSISFLFFDSSGASLLILYQGASTPSSAVNSSSLAKIQQKKHRERSIRVLDDNVDVQILEEIFTDESGIVSDSTSSKSVIHLRFEDFHPIFFNVLTALVDLTETQREIASAHKHAHTCTR